MKILILKKNEKNNVNFIQFDAIISIDLISENGALIYNAEDIDLNNIVSQSKSRVKKIPYTTPAYFVKDNVTGRFCS